VPDLILTPPLLSPKDDAALRELNGGQGVGTAGFHVQTLMTPVLAPADRPRGSQAGLLSRLRRAKPRDGAAEGCDPALFAAQIVEYLDRAAAERQALEIDPDAGAESAVVEPAVGSIAEPAEELAPETEAIYTSPFAAVAAEAAERPETPDVIDAPEFTDAHEFSQAAAAAEVNEAPEMSEAPEVPEFTDAPGMNDPPDDPWQDIALEEDEDDAPIVLTSELIDLKTFVEELDASSRVIVAADTPVESEALEWQAADPNATGLEAADADAADLDAAEPVAPDPPAPPRLAAAHALSARPAWPPH
jgi:hypothetical protein